MIAIETSVSAVIIELRNLDVLRMRLEQTAKIMLEVFQDLHDEDGVIIETVEEELDHP